MFPILQKSPENVNAEDLESLQNEIERRLVDLVSQKWELERELLALNCTSPDSSATSVTTETYEVPSKRFRPNTYVYNKRLPQNKHKSKVWPSKFRNINVESRPSKKQLLKNEAPDKLWPFVEQFCATPSQEQIKNLEEMIKTMENDKDYFKIPALGRKDSSSKDSPAKSTDGIHVKKKCKRITDEDAGLGALTQRLVSSFIEEVDEMSNDTTKSGDGSQSKKKNLKNQKASKSIDMNNAKNLEKRIRQELEDHDILEQQDQIPYMSEDDEILRDLVSSQHELLTIQKQNKDSMYKLLKRAKLHVELVEHREKFHEANADVIDAYHKLIQAKQRKRNLTEKEKESAWKALAAQEEAFKQCDDLYLSGLTQRDD